MYVRTLHTAQYMQTPHPLEYTDMATYEGRVSCTSNDTTNTIYDPS